MDGSWIFTEVCFFGVFASLADFIVSLIKSDEQQAEILTASLREPDRHLLLSVRDMFYVCTGQLT